MKLSVKFTVELVVLCVLIVGLGGFGVWQYIQLNARAARIAELESALLDSERGFASERETVAFLYEQLQKAQARLRALGEEIADVTGTLEKFKTLDPELLQKYSQVFFLNENYEPSELAAIRKRYLYDESASLDILAPVKPFLEEMIDDAKSDGIELFVRSAYRSFGTQSSLKSSYTVTYGSGANRFSADQGYSEHQLGTTVDFTTTGIGGGLDGFDATPAYEWLLDNAHRYGFTLSYPKGNDYYQFEPWHWRFVGTRLARKLERDHEHFYDLDQRDIDKYLLGIFD